MSRDPAVVSKNMSNIRSKDTSIEIKLRKALWHTGIRYRKKDKELLFLGWIVVHFWGKDILKHTAECVQVIKEVMFEAELALHDIETEDSSSLYY